MNGQDTDETKSASPRATYQDVLDAPAHKVAQVVDGTLYTHSRPASPHAIAASTLGGILSYNFHYGPGKWWILDEPELHLGEDIVVPDIAGWRRERMPEYPDAAYFTLAPDWLCEVLSPSTRSFDLGAKRTVYAREGVRILWLADPGARCVEVLQLRGAEWVLVDTVFGDTRVALPPFEAIRFNLGDLWLPHSVHRETPGASKTETEPELAEA